MTKVTCALSLFHGAAVLPAHAIPPSVRARTTRLAARRLLQRNICNAQAGPMFGVTLHVGPSPCIAITNRPKRP